MGYAFYIFTYLNFVKPVENSKINVPFRMTLLKKEQNKKITLFKYGTLCKFCEIFASIQLEMFEFSDAFELR